MLAALLQPPPADDLGARIQWIQGLVVAVENEDLGEVGAAVALDLKAALGAVVAWGRGPRDAESLLHLQALIAALLARATSTLYRVLATHWRSLVGDVDDAGVIAEAFESAAAAIAEGRDVPAEVQARLSAASRAP